MADDEVELDTYNNYYPRSPAEIRMMIINKMDPDVRCRFAGLSSLCEKEAQSSKYYIQSLGFRYMSASHIRIEVFHHIQQEPNEETHGYVLQFVEVSRHNRYYAQIGLDRVELWREDLPPNIDFIQHVKEYFLNMLQTFKDQIKIVTIRESPTVLFENLADRITSLRRLEELDVDETVNMVPFLPIVFNNRQPLKDLRIDGAEVNQLLGDFEQIYQVQNSIILEHLGLNMRNFERMVAKNIRIHIGQLTERDVHDIISRWTRGTLGRRMETYEWILTNSNFSVQILLQLMGRNRNSFASGRKIEIEKMNSTGLATIWWSRHDNCLEFHVEVEGD